MNGLKYTLLLLLLQTIQLSRSTPVTQLKRRDHETWVQQLRDILERHEDEEDDGENDGERNMMLSDNSRQNMQDSYGGRNRHFGFICRHYDPRRCFFKFFRFD